MNTGPRRLADGPWTVATLAPVLVLGLAALERIHAQDHGAADPSTTGAVLAAGVLGPWILNEELSENPVLRAGQAGSGDTLSIETVAKEWLGVDTFVGEQDQLVRTTDLRSRGLANVGVRFRTVYDRPAVDSASDHPFVDTAGGFARPATILIVPPERGYRQLLSGRVGFQMLVIDPAVAAVEYRLDGRPRSGSGSHAIVRTSNSTIRHASRRSRSSRTTPNTNSWAPTGSERAAIRLVRRTSST